MRLPRASGFTQPIGGTVMEGALVGGAHVSIWRLAVGVELAAGGRWLEVETCEVKGCMPVTSSDTRWQLELRARADWFIAPRFSAGVSYGRSVLDANDRTWMFGLSFHVRAFDGMP
jgi:hypothetical protein